MASASFDAGIEVGYRARVRRLTVKGYTPSPEVPYHRFRIIFVRAIVDDLDLHLVGAEILGQDTLERLRKIFSAIIGRDHNRPNRSRLGLRQRSYSRRCVHHLLVA